MLKDLNALLYLPVKAIRAQNKAHKLKARSRPLVINFLWLCRCFILRVGQKRRVILIGLVDHFGDIVAAEPVARYLRERYPQEILVWAVRSPYRELVESNPHLDKALVLGCLNEWMYLWKGLFSEVIDLHIRGRYCETCYCLYSRSGAAHINLGNYYHHGNLLSVFCQVAGLPELQDPPRVYIGDRHRQKIDSLDLPERFIAIHCKSNQKERDWQTAKWQSLVEEMAKTYGFPIIEVGLRPEVLDPPSGYRSLCGQLSLLETAEVIRRAEVFIGIDSGPAHLANAVGTYGIIIMGHFRDYRRYQPFSGGYARGEGGIILYADGPASSLKCDRVLEALERRLATSVVLEKLSPAPLVSVVVPTYNHRDYLPQTLDSVFRQTLQDFEVIVVNDGSPDDTREVIRPWLEAGKIVYIEQENSGASRARNRGLYRSRGKYIAYLDDDDLWPPDNLEKHVALMESNSDCVLVYGARACFTSMGDYIADKEPIDHPSGWVYEPFLLRNWIQSPGQTLMRTSIVQSLGGFDPQIWGSDDWEFYIRLARKGEFQFGDRVALEYRLHAQNASTRAAKHARNHLKVMGKHYPFNIPLIVHHLYLASRYFLPNLFASARTNVAEANYLAAIWALLHTLPFLLFNPLYIPQAIAERVIDRPTSR